MTKPEEEAAAKAEAAAAATEAAASDEVAEDEPIAALRGLIGTVEYLAADRSPEEAWRSVQMLGGEFDLRQGVFHRLTLAGVTAETSRPELLLGAWCATARQAILDAEPAAAEAEGVA